MNRISPLAKYLFVLVVSLFLSRSPVQACSMYKITRDGKTIVGNNEDWISPNNQFWFVQGEEGAYDVMNMGLLNNFAQGAINSAGLVFDGFAGAYLPVTNTEGKIRIPISEAVRHCMHSFASVREVKAYLSTINLSPIASGHLVFVDRTGEYLIAEGDELIIGDEAEQSFSNFYFSQIESKEDVDLPNYQNGLKFLKNSVAERSFDYCGAVMQNLPNPDEFTQYSTIYDLEKLTIRVYLYHDYSEYVEFDLREELKKGNHSVMMAELFPETSIGYQHYLKYNDPQHPTRFLEELVSKFSATKNEEELISNGFSFNLNWIGYEWLNDKEDAPGAIAIFKYGTELMPSDANLHDSLGEAYYRNGNYEEAMKSYKLSLKLNPDNENAVEMLQQISERKK